MISKSICRFLKLPGFPDLLEILIHKLRDFEEFLPKRSVLVCVLAGFACAQVILHNHCWSESRTSDLDSRTQLLNPGEAYSIILVHDSQIRIFGIPSRT